MSCDLDDLVHAYGHVRCFRETSVSTMFLHPLGREVHACARHGPHCFGGLRSFIGNPLLFTSGATTALVFYKPQNIKGTPCKNNVMPLYGRCQWVLVIDSGPPHEEFLFITTSSVFSSHPHIFLSLLMDCLLVLASCNKFSATCRMIAMAYGALPFRILE